MTYCNFCGNSVTVIRESKAKYGEGYWMVGYDCYTCKAHGTQCWELAKWKALKDNNEVVGQ